MNEWNDIGPEVWQRRGELYALDTFHRAAHEVPAYKQFLRTQGCDPRKVKTFADWEHVPITTKENYLAQYSLQELAGEGAVSAAACIHSSSGSTGQPQYWPCSLQELQRASKYYAAILRNAFQVHRRATLLMVCFGMGTWIAGSYTVASALLLQNEGLNLTVVTPGFNRSESLRILQNLAHNFEQVVIAGIPSFIKDLAETWHASPANKHSAVHFLLAGEPFPELWRSHVTAIQKEKPCHAISILGSADAGLIGFESNFTIELRQELSTDKELCLSVFETDRVPSLFHYDPTHRFIEVDQQQLLVTTNRVVPLIRYNTLDQGGICQPTMQSVITDSTPDRKSEPCWAGRLPLVYLFGRGARSTTLFGANIYAENIQEFLLSSRIAKLTSGRFYMRTDYDGQADQTFVVHVELADGANFSDLDLRQTAVELSLALRQRSSEYARIWEEYGERALPSLQLHPHGCPVHFPTNVHRKYS